MVTNVYKKINLGFEQKSKFQLLNIYDYIRIYIFLT